MPTDKETPVKPSLHDPELRRRLTEKLAELHHREGEQVRLLKQMLEIQERRVALLVATKAAVDAKDLDAVNILFNSAASGNPMPYPEYKAILDTKGMAELFNAEKRLRWVHTEMKAKEAENASS